jgi:NitT/TauT family transport system permease protein
MDRQPDRRERRWRATDRVAAVVLPVIGLALLVAAWWGAKLAFDIPTLLVPSPPEVVEAFQRLPDYVLGHAWYTLRMTVIGFGLSVLIGVSIAVAIASSTTLERMFYPLLVALNAVPKVALAPLLVLWLGFEEAPKVWMVVLICFFPIVVSTAYGLVSTPAELIEYARSLGAARWRAFVKVRFPNALPQVFVGLKVAISLALVGAVVGEFAGGGDGLGYVIETAGQAADTPVAFVAIVLLGIMSIALFYLVVGLERLLLPWAREISAPR